MTGPAGTPPRRAVLRDEEGPEGFWFEAASLSDEGLSIEGQSIWHDAALSEYEFAITVPAAQFPALLAALGARGDADVLDTLVAYYGAGGRRLKDLMEEHGIEFGFWNRIGD